MLPSGHIPLRDEKPRPEVRLRELQGKADGTNPVFQFHALTVQET